MTFTLRSLEKKKTFLKDVLVLFLALLQSKITDLERCAQGHLSGVDTQGHTWLSVLLKHMAVDQRSMEGCVSEEKLHHL